MITAIGMVKNAADVIETCIRGNAVTVDNFVLLDNMSTDNTVSILNRLIQEGFRIEILQDDDISYCQGTKMKQLLTYTLEKYDSDFIIPLDDDEIIVSGNENLKTEDVKNIIYALDRGNLYYVNWRVYIPTEEDDRMEKCVAKRQNFCYGDEPEMTTKIIIPREICSDDFQIIQGNHRAEGSAVQSHVLIKDIRIAHYPVRSAEQFRSKALIGWTNYLALPQRDEGLGYHWRIMYEQVKSGGKITVDLLQMMSLLYRVTPMDDRVTIQRIPVALPQKCFEMRYTSDHEINALKNYCMNVEQLAGKYAKLLEEKPVSECIMSTLPKTWIFDLDGTLLKHNGYKLDGKDTLLSGVKEYLDDLPTEDKIILCTSRTDEYKDMTLAFLEEQQIRYDEILFNMPMGERIMVNDRKPSGLDMAVALNLERDVFELPRIRREK